jgi:hypothetical protein
MNRYPLREIRISSNSASENPFPFFAISHDLTAVTSSDEISGCKSDSIKPSALLFAPYASAISRRTADGAKTNKRSLHFWMSSIGIFIFICIYIFQFEPGLQNTTAPPRLIARLSATASTARPPLESIPAVGLILRLDSAN